MTHSNKLFSFFGLYFFILIAAHHVRAETMPALENVLLNGFPARQDELAKTTGMLLQEYQKTNNIAALVFYSYGMLRQANHFSTVNDFIHASEYSKIGFFYLDEAVETHENDPRVRYLRARIDAYLPADIGRCVVALRDTDQLLNHQQSFDASVRNHISFMRYRALYSCRQYEQASQLLARLKRQGVKSPGSQDPMFEMAPAWAMSEVNQILLPLVKGE
jgi:hypothetical protein